MSSDNLKNNFSRFLLLEKKKLIQVPLLSIHNSFIGSSKKESFLNNTEFNNDFFKI